MKWKLNTTVNEPEIKSIINDNVLPANDLLIIDHVLTWIDAVIILL